MAETAEFLTNTWYMVMPGRLIKSGQITANKVLNCPIVLGQSKTGEAFTLRDMCPHRSIRN